VCGDATIWKPSEKNAAHRNRVTKIAERVCRETGADPAIFTLLVGDRKTVGQKLADDPHIPLVSATGSTNMGFNVAKAVNGRLGRTILELGGNNALIVTPSADLGDGGAIDLFRRRGYSRTALHFDTPGHHARVSCSKVRDKLLNGYKTLAIGNPLDRKTVMGPLIDRQAVDTVQDSIQRLKDEGGRCFTAASGSRFLARLHEAVSGCCETGFRNRETRNLRAIALPDDVSRLSTRRWRFTTMCRRD
jgi:NAD-dependent aldehyde dehydrogenases